MLQHPPEKQTGTNTVHLSSRISFVPLHRLIKPLSYMTSPLFFGNQQFQGSKATLVWDLQGHLLTRDYFSFTRVWGDKLWVVLIWQFMPTLNSALVLLWLAAYRDKPVYAFLLKWSYKLQIHFYAGSITFQQGRAWFHHMAHLLYFFCSKIV